MVITYEVLNEDTLPILEQLERLHLLRRVPENATGLQQDSPSDVAMAKVKLKAIVQNQRIPAVTPSKKGTIPLKKKSLAGSLSPDTAQKLREHIETVRNEWDHRI